MRVNGIILNSINPTSIPLGVKSCEINNCERKDIQLNFCGSPVKVINLAAEKSKLLKQIETILESFVEDSEGDYTSRLLRYMLLKLERQKKLIEEYDKFMEESSVPGSKNLVKLMDLKKECEALKKMKFRSKPKSAPKNPDDRFDPVLLNRFKSALLQDNFSLKKVFLDYYSGLSDIKTIKELKAKYPQIKIPENPLSVVTQKMSNALTRDFYTGLSDVVASKDIDKIFGYIDSKGKELLKTSEETFHGDFFQKLKKHFREVVLQKYSELEKNNRISSVPENKKSPKVLLSVQDAKLLNVDFDDFVLSCLRRQYLNFEKPNNIVYEANGVSIPLSSLSGGSYGFEKISEKLKSMLSTGELLKYTQRNYEKFTVEQLRARLAFYASGKIAEDETILSRIIDFDSCSFTEEDRKNLSLFLKELDKIYDKEQTLSEGLRNIVDKEMLPKGTRELDEIERKKVAEKIKAEQKVAVLLAKLQENFDNTINSLYMSDLSGLAAVCSKYRVSSLEPSKIQDAEFIIKSIEQYLGKNNKYLEAKITRWDTYNMVSKKGLSQSVIDFATDESGILNKEKAGQYIINSEMLEIFKDSPELIDNPEIYSKVLECKDFDKAVRYLCKFNDYEVLGDKTFLSNYVHMFNLKDPIEKNILKYIVENEYVNSVTSVESGAAITSAPKIAIMDRYKFPGCLKYLEAFEDALSKFSTSKGNGGIKLIGRNNKAAKYKMELKIPKEDDRLFSSNNDYIFDVYSPIGYH